MEPDFWHQRWREQRIGFHRRDINPYLPKFWARVAIKPGERVFVPLCGKSLDMLWLRERYRVLGVELSPIAVEEFLAENSVAAEKRQQGRFTVYESADLCLLRGDFFDLEPVQLEGVRAVYDRAALVALPADMRQRYVNHLTVLLPAEASVLLVAMEYDEQQMTGPPFAVEEHEVHHLFANDWSIELLHSEAGLASEPGLRARGLSELVKKVYLLNRQ